jgi:hypothetical protein
MKKVCAGISEAYINRVMKRFLACPPRGSSGTVVRGEEKSPVEQHMILFGTAVAYRANLFGYL